MCSLPVFGFLPILLGENLYIKVPKLAIFTFEDIALDLIISIKLFKISTLNEFLI